MSKRRELVESYFKKHKKVAISTLLEAVDISNNAWYYCKKEKVRKDKVEKEIEKEGIVKKIKEVLFESPYYGYRRTTAELKRKGNKHNRKRILKIMGEYLLIQPRKRKNNFPKTTNSKHKYTIYTNEIKDLKDVLPGVVWVSDITYIWVNGVWVYLALVLDQSSRKIVGWSLAKSLSKQLAIDALEMALNENEAPKYHHSDRGVQYCSDAYIKILKDNQIIPSMADVGKSVDNPHAEALNRSIKVEEVYLNAYESFSEAKASIGNYIVVYNTKRLHSSLGYVTPIEFEMSFYQKLTVSGVA